jgi:hypothetical protein
MMNSLLLLFFLDEHTRALLLVRSADLFKVCLSVWFAGAFQITFRTKMHASDFFYFLKIIFDISTSKRSKTYKPY